MIHLDVETRSKCDLKNKGAVAYAAHPSTEVICMAWAVDDGPINLWKMGEVLPEFPADEIYAAHNAGFEDAIFKHTLKLPPLNWVCSAAKCAAHSLPRALGKAADALGLDVRKDEDGKRVMMQLCKPRKPSKADPNEWHTPETYPEKFEALYAYNKDDVAVERAIDKELRDLNPLEQKVWALDQKINERGIRVDIEAVKASIKVSNDYSLLGNERMAVVTNGAVSKATEAKKLTEWIRSKGINMNGVTKQEVIDTLNMDLPADVKEALEIRQKLGKTSVAKYKKIINAVSDDDRLHGLLLYHGAHTGRWTGMRVQPQNFPRRKDKGDLDTYFRVLKQTPDSFGLFYPDVMDMVSQMLRPCIIASEGTSLYGGDYASIEARVLLWLADDERALNVFRNGGDIYRDLASTIYKIPAEEIGQDSKERQLGKQGILLSGFGGGAGSFFDTCQSYGIKISMEEAKVVVETYRNKYPKVKSMWYAQERAALQAVKTSRYVSCGKIGWGKSGDFLLCKLPSKRLLAYYSPKIEARETPWGDMKDCLTYMGVNSVTRKFERMHTYGGKIVENITQGVARDLLAEAMLAVEDGGYDIVMHTHDEITGEHSDGSIEEFEKLMCTLPDWGLDIPVAVEGWENERYIK